jgi:hypothetical protein
MNVASITETAIIQGFAAGRALAPDWVPAEIAWVAIR